MWDWFVVQITDMFMWTYYARYWQWCLCWTEHAYCSHVLVDWLCWLLMFAWDWYIKCRLLTCSCGLSVPVTERDVCVGLTDCADYWHVHMDWLCVLQASVWDWSSTFVRFFLLTDCWWLKEWNLSSKTTLKTRQKWSLEKGWSLIRGFTNTEIWWEWFQDKGAWRKGDLLPGVLL